MRFIDLRSDTVTMPTDKMRKAMAEAEVGDSIYRDDPTLNELEKRAAEKVGKEAAIFVPSGTFGNQLCLFTHCTRGQEIIIGRDYHIVVHEVGAPAVIAGVQLRTLDTGIKGELDPKEVEKAGSFDSVSACSCGAVYIASAFSNWKKRRIRHWFRASDYHGSEFRLCSQYAGHCPEIGRAHV